MSTTRLASLACSLAAVTALLPAQNDYNLDKISPAILGGPLDLRVTGAPPNQSILYVVSENAGPTPLAWVDPFDARVAEVGIELIGVSGIGSTGPTGAVDVGVLLPNTPSAHGAVLHWQSVILLPQPGPAVFGALGNKVISQVGIAGLGANAPSSMVDGRAFAAGLVDANNNGGAGDVLITGGGAGTLTAATGLATTELWDFRRMQRLAGPTMGTSRALHLAVRLNDNRVLIVGGADATGAVLSSCEIYDPVTNLFTPTNSMGTPRVLHAACKLADGRVMVAGGTSALQPDVTAAITGTLSSVEIYDPATGLWSPASAIGGRRLGPALTLLSNNQVLVSGGVAVTLIGTIPIAANSTTACQRWNPATQTWGAANSMPSQRAGHHYNQVTLADGRVLMTGGVNVPGLLTAASSAPIAAADVYNPTTNTWGAVNMTNARALHSATRLADGRVVVAGGAQGTLLAPVSIANVDIFNPATNTWSASTALLQPRASHVGQLLPDGLLVLFGGQGAATTLTDVETLRF